MKRTLFLLAIIWFSLSCSDDDAPTPGLLGTWQLTEVLIDPGDGSGEFSPVESDRVVRFFENGRVTSNATLCHISSESGEASEGVYSLQDSTITPTCPEQEFVSNIRIDFEGDNLILRYLCFEACAEKYVKL